MHPVLNVYLANAVVDQRRIAEQRRHQPRQASPLATAVIATRLIRVDPVATRPPCRRGRRGRRVRSAPVV